MASKETLDAMTTWVAAIADNVKNPIAGIAAALEHIEGRMDETDLVETAMARIRDRLTILNEYVSELSDFGRPAVIKPETINVRDLLVDAVRITNLPAACLIEIETSMNTFIHVDRSKLVLAIKAVLRNAFESVDRGDSPQIAVEAAPRSDHTVIISFDDNGAGLAPDVARQAFEPFYSTKEAGTGLGLAIARKYVAAHQGTLLMARSTMLGGCRIEMTLPLAASSAGANS